MVGPWARAAGQLLTPERGSHGLELHCTGEGAGDTDGAFPPGHLPAPESVWLLSTPPEQHLFLKYSDPKHLKSFMIVQRQLRNIKAREGSRASTDHLPAPSQDETTMRYSKVGSRF